MFKLVKIEGSGTNQAEPIRMKTSEYATYRAHCAYMCGDGTIDSLDSESVPTYIALENAEPGEKESILCYRIQSNMIFEVPVNGSFTALNADTKYVADISEDGSGVGITTSTVNGKITLCDPNGAKRSKDTVYVRIV